MTIEVDFSEVARRAEDELLSKLCRPNPWRDRVRHPTVPGIDPESWWGCDFPERAADDFVLWLYSCDGCLIHLATAARLEPCRQGTGVFGLGSGTAGRAASWSGIYIETCIYRAKRSSLPTWAVVDLARHHAVTIEESNDPVV